MDVATLASRRISPEEVHVPRYLLPMAERKLGEPESASGAAWKDLASRHSS
jgi:hypothetical protein